MTSPILGLFNLGGEQIILILAFLLIGFVGTEALIAISFLLIRAIRSGAESKLRPHTKL